MSSTPTVRRAHFQVNTTDAAGANLFATNVQDFSKVVLLSDGRFLVAFQDGSTNFSGLEPHDIVGQIFDANGNRVGNEVYLSGTYGDFDQSAEDIASLPNGGFLAAYQSQDAAGFGDGLNIAVEVFNSAGTRVRVDDFRQGNNPPTVIDDTHPTVTSFADGSYVLVYEQSDSGANRELVGYVVDAMGNRSAKFLVLNAPSAADESNPDSAQLGAGYVVAYQQTNATNDVRFAIRTLAGGLTEGTVAAGAGQETAPVVASLTGGRFVVAWQDSDGDAAGNAGVRARIFASDGTAVTGAFIVPTTTAGAQLTPAITALADGSFVIAWLNQVDHVLYGQRFSVDGVRIGGEFALGDGGSMSEPSLALLGDGSFVATMSLTGGGDTDVHATIFDPREHLGPGPLTPTTLMADVNADGRNDLIDLGGGTARVQLATGTQFAAAQPWANGATANDRLADVNGDGRADLLQYFNGRELVSLSSGTSFGAWTQWTAGASANDALVDVNGDGKVDLVQYYNGRELVALSNGTSFGAYTQWAIGASANDRLADLDNDGKADLVQYYNGRELVALSNGTSFGAWTEWVSGATASDRLADVNGDGRADLVQYFNGRELVALSNGVGFGAWNQWVVGATANDRLADVNGDGKVDLVQFFNGRELVALSTGTGFGTWAEWANGATANDKFADVNGDAKADLLQVFNGHTYAALSNGTGFDSWQIWA